MNMETKIPSVISAIAIKGGVGKTTILSCLANELADRGKKVLIMDLDNQCSISMLFDKEFQQDKNVYEMFEKEDMLSNVMAVDQVPGRNKIDLIPGNLGLGSLAKKMDSTIAREFILKRLFYSTFIEDERYLNMPYDEQYDYVLIDCHPDFNLINMNVACISDMILSPVNPNGFSALSIQNLQVEYEVLRKTLSLPDDNLYFLLNKLKHNTSASRELKEEVLEFEGQYNFLKTVIPEYEPFNKISLQREPLSLLKGSGTIPKAIKIVKDLGDEVEKIIEGE